MIKRFNPFILIAILSIVLIALWFSVQSRRISIQEKNIELASYEQKAKNLKNLKGKWQQNKISAKLHSVVSDPKLKKNTTIKTKSDKVLMNVKQVSKGQIDMILKNLLNEPFDIRRIDIKRIDENNLEFNLEVMI